jgi:hypothetical protein
MLHVSIYIASLAIFALCTRPVHGHDLSSLPSFEMDSQSAVDFTNNSAPSFVVCLLLLRNAQSYVHVLGGLTKRSFWSSQRRDGHGDNLLDDLLRDSFDSYSRVIKIVRSLELRR